METVYYRLLTHNRFLRCDFFFFNCWWFGNSHISYLQVFNASCMHHITSQAHVEHICAPENVCTHKADHKRCTVSSSVFYASSSKIYFHCSLSIPHFCTQIAPCMFNNSLFFYFSPCFKQQVKFCLLYMDIIEICQMSHFSLFNAIHSHYSLLRQFYRRRQRGQKT